MTPAATKKRSRLYRYYTSKDAIRNCAGTGTGGIVRLNAGLAENAVTQQIRALLRTPEVAHRPETVRSEAFRSMALSLEKHFSIGLKPGL